MNTRNYIICLYFDHITVYIYNVGILKVEVFFLRSLGRNVGSTGGELQ